MHNPECLKLSQNYQSENHFVFKEAQLLSEDQMNDINSADKFINKVPAGRETVSSENIGAEETVKNESQISDQCRTGGGGDTIIAGSVNNTVDGDGMSKIGGNGTKSAENTSVVEISETENNEITEGNEEEANHQTTDTDEIAEAVEGKVLQ